MKGRMKEDTPWDSGLVVIPPMIILQPNVSKILSSIQKSVSTCEFSALFKGEWTDNGYLVTNEYLVPLQRVDSTSVDYDEDISVYRGEGYNVIAHSHPFCRSTGSFSTTDDETINSHFPCSILCNDGGEVVAGNLLLDVKGTDIKMSVPVEKSDIFTEKVLIEIEGIDRIKEKPRHVYQGKFSHLDNNDYLDDGYGV